MFETVKSHMDHVLRRTKRYISRCERLGLNPNDAPGHIREKFKLIEAIAKAKGETPDGQ